MVATLAFCRRGGVREGRRCALQERRKRKEGKGKGKGKGAKEVSGGAPNTVYSTNRRREKEKKRKEKKKCNVRAYTQAPTVTCWKHEREGGEREKERERKREKQRTVPPEMAPDKWVLPTVAFFKKHLLENNVQNLQPSFSAQREQQSVVVFWFPMIAMLLAWLL